MIKFIPGLLFVGFTAASQAQAVASVTDAQNKSNVSVQTGLVNLQLDNMKLADAIREIARVSGRKITFAPTLIPAKRVSYRGVNVSPETALGTILSGTGLRLEGVANGSLVLVQGNTPGKPVAQGVIAGRVSDAKSGRGISGATVSIGSDIRSVTTTETGDYRLAGVPAGMHTVSVRLVGYAKQSRSLTVGEGAMVAVDFKLEPSANVLDQVIVTGTVTQTELKAVPNAITVVTSKDIEEKAITRIDQLFRGDIPGLFVRNEGTANGLDQVTGMFSRGVTSLEGAFTTIKTYLDGIELADPSYLSQIDPASIDRIEIITGPQASTIYGSNAINGVMQIFTKRGISKRPQIAANLISGLVQNNFSSTLSPQHDYGVQVNGTEGSILYNIGGSWLHVGRWSPSKQTSRINGFGGGRVQRASMDADANFRVSDTKNRPNGSSAQQTVSDRESGLLTGPGANGLTKPTTNSARSVTTGVGFTYNPFSWWSHQLVVGRDATDFQNLVYGLSYSSPSDTNFAISGTHIDRLSQRYATIVQASSVGQSRVTLTGGIDHWSTKSGSQTVVATTLTGNLPNPSITRDKPGKNLGGFFQGQLGIADALFLTYGLRFEKNANYGNNIKSSLAPRYGVAYTKNIGLLTTKFRASYGKATRPPLPFQKKSETYAEFQGAPDPTYGNFIRRQAAPELEPEFQQGGEGGVELYFANRGSLVVTRYNQTVDNLIALVTVDSVRSLLPDAFTGLYSYFPQQKYLNVGSIRNQGWELQGTLNTGPFRTRGTYSWTKSRVIGITPKYRGLLIFSNYQPGSPFTFLPEHTWAINLAYARSRTDVSLNVNGTGFLYPSGTVLTRLISANVRLPGDRPRMQSPNGYRANNAGYAMADVNASHRFSNRLEGILQLTNLTDFYRSDYLATSAIIGRQSRAGVRIRM